MKNIVEIMGTSNSMSDLLIEVAEAWIFENLGAEAYRKMTHEEFAEVESQVMSGNIQYRIVGR